MDLTTALHLLAKSHKGKDVDSSKLAQAKQIIAHQSEEVPCPVCNYYKVPRNHRENGIPCLMCISAKHR